MNEYLSEHPVERFKQDLITVLFTLPAPDMKKVNQYVIDCGWFNVPPNYNYRY